MALDGEGKSSSFNSDCTYSFSCSACCLFRNHLTSKKLSGFRTSGDGCHPGRTSTLRLGTSTAGEENANPLINVRFLDSENALNSRLDIDSTNVEKANMSGSGVQSSISSMYSFSRALPWQLSCFICSLAVSVCFLRKCSKLFDTRTVRLD